MARLPMIHETALIHPLACVTDSEVGARSKVWQFASIIRGAIIGSDCTIGSGAIVDGSFVGSHSLIEQNAAISPGFVLGEGVFVGPNATLCNDTWPRASKAGFSGFISAMAFANDAMRRREAAIVIEDGASVGANAVVLPGVIIGECAMVAAGSVVTRNIPPFHIWRDGEAKLIPPDMEQLRVETRIRRAYSCGAALDA